MTRPRRFLTRMVLFVAMVAVVAAVLFPALSSAFMANPALNGLIVFVVLFGIGLNFRQVLRLGPEVDWVERFRAGEVGLTQEQVPPLLGGMAQMLTEHKEKSLGRGRFSISVPAMRSLMDGLASRLDEARDLARYIMGLSIFLGLLGTFWGLLETVSSIGFVIRDLTIAGDNPQAVFDDLKSGLEAPLAGMGTAFSSSLLGLAGSLVLGFLDIQSSRAQNTFLNDLEEWLSGLTRLSSGGGLGEVEGGGSVPAYIQALLEQTADSLDDLQRTIARGEEGRVATQSQIRSLVDTLGTLAEQMRTEQAVLLRLAESHADLRPLMQRLVEATEHKPDGGVDEATRGHIRNLDAAVTYMANEMSSSREQTVKELRAEIKVLARTIAVAAGMADQQPPPQR
ncbi:flagellar motor protein MotA [Roseospira navarrensis]|uniref:Flagellar motor protein MotA n=1 Tax=Roseospira navarrensis TaxID=140058 RepID=A0A7X1ZGP7_9PROT|nr:flagellar motor protein MotA [Roseospira navarrensis]MQX37291.1 flagellar motor protein MotA [Roseospira navarrensis]